MELTLLFAQAEAATPTTIVGAFIAVSVSLAALLGWVLRHVFITTIPSIVSSHDATVAAICKEFRETTTAERAECSERYESLNGSILGLTKELGASRESIIGRVNEHSTAQASLYRHEIRNLINNAVLGKELAEAKLKGACDESGD